VLIRWKKYSNNSSCKNFWRRKG